MGNRQVQVPGAGDNAPEPEEGSWLDHSYTRSLAKAARERESECLRALVDAALGGTDPRASAAAASFLEAQANRRILTEPMRRR